MRIGANPVVSRDVLSMRLLDCAIFYTAVRWNHGCEEVNCSPASREAAQAACDQWRTRALGEPRTEHAPVMFIIRVRIQ